MVISAACLPGTASAEGHCEKPVRLGWATFPPYMYRNAQGQLQGIDYEMLVQALQPSGCKLAYDQTEVPWERQLHWIESGAVDVVVDATVTPERRRYAYFSKPYREEVVALFVRRGESTSFSLTSLNDIATQPNFHWLGTFHGWAYGEDFSRLLHNPAFKAKTYEAIDDDQNLKMLQAKRIDGILLDDFGGTQMLRQKGYLNATVERYPMPPIFSGKVSFMFSKRTVSPALVSEVNARIDQMVADKSYEALVRKYQPGE